MLYKKEFGGETFGIIIKPFMIFDHYNFQFFYIIIYIFINIIFINFKNHSNFIQSFHHSIQQNFIFTKK